VDGESGESTEGDVIEQEKASQRYRDRIRLTERSREKSRAGKP